MKNYNGKLCLALSNTFNLSEIEQVEKFSQHGIDGFFALYQNYEQVARLKDKADSCDMFFQSIHAKHHPTRSLWYDDENAYKVPDIIKDIIRSI